MYVESAELRFYIPHAFTLKDKRQILRSLTDKTRRRFNVSIAETGTQDLPKTITIGVAVVSGDYAHAGKMLENIIRFMEEHTEGDLTEVIR